MKALRRNVKIAIVVLLIITLGLGYGLFYQMEQSQTSLLAVAGENKQSLAKLYSQAGTIYTRDKVKLATSESGRREYAENPSLEQASSHIVGDYTHHMSNTIETLYQNELLGKNRNIIDQLLLDFSGEGLQGDDLYLTLDSGLETHAYDLLKNNKGAAVVMNYKTGEILASVSTPATSMDNIIAYENIPDTALYNRALNGAYMPGSTWKIVTSAAWLNSNSYDPDLIIETNGDPLRANGASDADYKHISGKYDLYRAFAESCNVFFGELAVKMGQEEFMQAIERMGLEDIKNVDRLNLTPAVIDNSAAKDDPALLSWFGVGQAAGDLKINLSPTEIALISSAVANNGKMPEPHLVDYKMNVLGKDELSEVKTKEVLNPMVADKVEQLMLGAINSDFSFLSSMKISGYDVAGKTGTVQVQADGQNSTNSLFTGFIANDSDNPFVVAVVLEDKDNANTTATAIARSLLVYAINNILV